VTVVEDNLPIEVTTFRGEGAYSDGRRPDEVRFGVPLVDDLARRDFTINAMAWDPLQQKLHDPFGGRADLANRLVRAVGDPHARFSEDGLRPMRAVRIAAVLEFVVEAQTLDAIPSTLATFRKVAIERIREEFLKILGAPAPSVGLALLRETALLAEFLPEASPQEGNPRPYRDRSAWEEALRWVDAVSGSRLYRLAALLLPVVKEPAPTLVPGDTRFYPHQALGNPRAEEIGRRLRLSAEEVALVSSLVAHYPFSYAPQVGDAEVRRFLRRVGLDLLPGLVSLWRGEVSARAVPEGNTAIDAFQTRIERVLAERPALSMKDLALSGEEVMRAGVPKGPKVGEALRFLLERVTEDPAQNSRDALLALLPEALGQRPAPRSEEK
jgi:tRNA nucleotidyltransferase (CCA-adding enzyme)